MGLQSQEGKERQGSMEAIFDDCSRTWLLCSWPNICPSSPSHLYAGFHPIYLTHWTVMFFQTLNKRGQLFDPRLRKAIWRIIIWLFKLSISRLFRIGWLMIGYLSPVPSLKTYPQSVHMFAFPGWLRESVGSDCLINHMEFGKGDLFKEFFFTFPNQLTWYFEWN